jgi:hypothetical protein
MVNGTPPIRDKNFSPGAMRQWIGHLALIEKDSKGGLRFRLAGTNLQARFGAELNHKRFADIDAEILGDLEDRVGRAIQNITPVVKIVPVPTKREKYFDLILPLANREGAIDLVVLACAPVRPEM